MLSRPFFQVYLLSVFNTAILSQEQLYWPNTFNLTDLRLPITKRVVSLTIYLVDFFLLHASSGHTKLCHTCAKHYATLPKVCTCIQGTLHIEKKNRSYCLLYFAHTFLGFCIPLPIGRTILSIQK